MLNSMKFLKSYSIIEPNAILDTLSHKKSDMDTEKLYAYPPTCTFNVKLDATGGLGLGLVLDPSGLFVVGNFNTLSNGLEGPALLSNSIEIGDILLEINCIELRKESTETVLDIFKVINYL
jgi:hypothetical protein